MASTAILECSDLSKSYGENTHLTVLKDIHFSIQQAQSIAVVGKSGSGKSTLLQLLAGLMPADSGNVNWFIDKEFISIQQIKEERVTRIRNQFLGFIFQFHHLLPEFDALENVMLPMLIAKKSKEKAKEKAYELLKRVGLESRLTHYPSQLSGGEQQRVAICRALINDPKIILADEPTGNLDEYHAKEVLALLQQLQEELAIAMVIATHDASLEATCDKVAFLSNGSLIEK
jgi:lipoprotein-releasing system ATP-binding protein